MRHPALLLVSSLTLALVGCVRDNPSAPAPAPAPQVLVPQTPAPPAPPQPVQVELRAFDVPQALASELANVINSQLYRAKDEAPLGRATVGPGGQLLVTAPPGVLDGVASLLKRIEAAPPAAPPVVVLTWWMVQATPSDVATPLPPALKEVAPALEAVAAADGPRSFSLVEKLTLQQASGAEAHLEGRDLSVHQTASARDGKVLAEVSLSRIRGPGNVRTQVALPEGQLLVLGQIGALPASDGAVTGDVYFVVRATVVGAGK